MIVRPGQRLFAYGLGAGVLLTNPLLGQSGPPRDVSFYGSPDAIISSGVVIPSGRSTLWTSGITPPLLRPDLPAGAPERFGDTRTQASGVLTSIEAQLAAQGLSLRDVVYIRAYLVPDSARGGQIDVAGWNAAFSDFFGSAKTPVKPARSTVGVVALVNREWLVEIEAFAVYPR